MTTWDQLNGYVDGELDATSAAIVEAEIARDPEVAARVATLHRLKAMTQSAGQPSSDFPLPPLPATGNVKAPSLARGAIAASLMTVLCAGLIWLLLPWNDSNQRTGSIQLNKIFDAHLVWAGSPASDAAGTLTPAHLGAPDLSAAGMRLAFQRRDIVASGDVLYGYVGPHGCKLSLWMGPALDGFKGLTSEPRQQESWQGVDAFAWLNLSTVYTVAAKGMDPSRLKRLTFATARLLTRGQVSDDTEQIALNALARDAKPCHA